MGFGLYGTSSELRMAAQSPIEQPAVVRNSRARDLLEVAKQFGSSLCGEGLGELDERITSISRV